MCLCTLISMGIDIFHSMFFQKKITINSQLCTNYKMLFTYPEDSI